MKKSPLVKYIIWSTVAFLVIICFFRHDNLIRWIRAGFTIRKQEKQKEFYEADIARLKDEVKSLTTDKDTLEKFAREKFLFSEPGEDVYVIE